MDIREFSYFLAIVDNGSITKASASLFISQPSLSIFLKKLEDRLGTPLFSRVGTKMYLTTEGKVYEEYARRIVMINKELEQRFSDLENLNSGFVRIGLTSNRGSLMLKLLPLIHKEYPNMRIELVEASSEELEELVISHKIDFALLSRPFRNYDLNFVPLWDEECILAIPDCFDVRDKLKQVPYSKYPWIDINEIKDLPVVLSKHGQRLRQISDYVFLVNNITPNVFMETKSIYTILTSLLLHSGIGFLLDSYLDQFDFPRDNTLFCSVGPEHVTKLQYVIAYPIDGYLSISAQKCIELLTAEAPNPSIFRSISPMF